MKRPDTTPEAFTPQKLEIGKGVIRREGSDITVIAADICVSEAILAADRLSLQQARYVRSSRNGRNVALEFTNNHIQ